MNVQTVPAQAVDPITADIIINRVRAIPNLVDKDITRTSFSLLISEYKDYSVGILDCDARLVAQAKGGLPIFIANALSAAIRDGLKVYGKKRLQSGDVIISNHGATMGQHLNNVAMYTPIRVSEDDDGLVGFCAVLMHWVDIGGIVVGSCLSYEAREIYQEGIQYRSVKLIKEGERIEEMFRIIEENTRFPEMVLGDLESQIAGCLTGRDMALNVVASHGAATVKQALRMLLDRSERVTRAEIRKIPNGIYRASSFLDSDPGNPGETVPVEIAVHVEDEDIIVDLDGIGRQAIGPINAGYEGGAVAAVRIACKYLFAVDIPANEGTFRPITLKIREGTFLSARPGSALSGSGHTMATVVDTIVKAFADVLPQRVPAGHHGTYGLHVIFGRRPSDQSFFQHIESTIGGWGASRDRDGSGPYRSYVHGDTLEVPAELQEAENPYRIEMVRLRQDSGGPGEYRGGLGVEKTYRILASCTLSVNIERTKCRPWGLHGGGDGLPGRLEVEKPDGKRIVITKGELPLEVDDLVHVFSAGGGGYGEVRCRNPEKVRRDIELGFVSQTAARETYGFTRPL